MEASYSETKCPTAIYANEKAMNTPPAPLSEALRQFARFDNRLFKQELIEERPNDKKRSSSVSPASPSKRLQRSSSTDSLATNRASLGDLSDRDMADAPLIGDFDDDNHGGSIQSQGNGEGSRDQESSGTLGTEMVQLAISMPVLAGTGAGAAASATNQEESRVTDAEASGFIADWDNPEGKPVAAAKGALDD